MSALLKLVVWSLYGGFILFVWAYVAFWALFAFGAEWFGGVLMALALTVGGFLLVRRLV